jgi:ferrochelatase
MSGSTFDSVLLIGFGGPTRLDEVRPFLANVVRGRPIPASRLEEVASHYERLGGSPFYRLTLRQAGALQNELQRVGPALPVHVGMRNWHPFLGETLREMRSLGHCRAVGLILSAQQTEAGWSRYVEDVRLARADIGAGAPEVVFAPPWPTHPLFIEALVDRLRSVLNGMPPAARAEVHVVCTAHSVPLSMATDSSYESDVETAARLVCESAGVSCWSVAYQSRSGSPLDRWLEPDINDALRALAGRGTREIVVLPVGFVCDHVEVLYDIGVEAMSTAHQCGVHLRRAETVNDHPVFIRMLADVVRRMARGEA